MVFHSWFGLGYLLGYKSLLYQLQVREFKDKEIVDLKTYPSKFHIQTKVEKPLIKRKGGSNN